MRFQGKVALITGGTSGIGRATAVLFAAEGAAVTITGRDEERGAAVVGEIAEAGGRGLFVHADVRSAEDCRRSVAATLDAFGRLDVLFNNAGIYVANDTVGCDEDEWDLQVDTSLKGAFLMSREALPSMIAQGSGSIIHCSSAGSSCPSHRSNAAWSRADRALLRMSPRRIESRRGGGSISATDHTSRLGSRRSRTM